MNNKNKFLVVLIIPYILSISGCNFLPGFSKVKLHESKIEDEYHECSKEKFLSEWHDNYKMKYTYADITLKINLGKIEHWDSSYNHFVAYLTETDLRNETYRSGWYFNSLYAFDYGYFTPSILYQLYYMNHCRPDTLDELINNYSIVKCTTHPYSLEIRDSNLLYTVKFDNNFMPHSCSYESKEVCYSFYYKYFNEKDVPSRGLGRISKELFQYRRYINQFKDNPYKQLIIDIDCDLTNIPVTNVYDPELDSYVLEYGDPVTEKDVHIKMHAPLALGMKRSMTDIVDFYLVRTFEMDKEVLTIGRNINAQYYLECLFYQEFLFYPHIFVVKANPYPFVTTIKDNFNSTVLTVKMEEKEISATATYNKDGYLTSLKYKEKDTIDLSAKVSYYKYG